MRRRDFISIFGSAAAAWPLAARGQQAMPTIGLLHRGTATPVIEAQLAAFRHGLKEGGYVEGQNLAIEYRWGEGKNERLPELAADLVRRNVNVIAAVGGPASNQAGKNATSTIPVVFNAGADPVKQGLVTNLRRPGGNVTGITFLTEELGAKGLSLLRDLVPKAKRVGLVLNPSNPETPRRSAEAIEAARKLGLTMEVVHAEPPLDIDKAFDTLMERRVEALLLGADVSTATTCRSSSQSPRATSCQSCTTAASLSMLAVWQAMELVSSMLIVRLAFTSLASSRVRSRVSCQ
jgi:putative ABC transport system substrate-binding protein